MSAGGTARRDMARRGRSDAVVRDERDGRGEGMTGGGLASVRAVRSGGGGWVASGVRWARPLGFLFLIFLLAIPFLILFLLIHQLFGQNYQVINSYNTKTNFWSVFPYFYMAS